MKLLEQFVELAEERTVLMGVFAIAEGLLVVESHAERFGGCLAEVVEVVEDSRIIARGNLECFLGEEEAIFER